MVGVARKSGARLRNGDFFATPGKIDQRPSGRVRERETERAREGVKERKRERKRVATNIDPQGEAKYNDTSHQASESTRRDLTDFAPR